MVERTTIVAVAVPVAVQVDEEFCQQVALIMFLYIVSFVSFLPLNVHLKSLLRLIHRAIDRYFCGPSCHVVLEHDIILPL